MLQISYPPANGARQGNYFLAKSHKLGLFKKMLNMDSKTHIEKRKRKVNAINFMGEKESVYFEWSCKIQGF